MLLAALEARPDRPGAQPQAADEDGDDRRRGRGGGAADEAERADPGELVDEGASAGEKGQWKEQAERRRALGGVSRTWAGTVHEDAVGADGAPAPE